MFTPSDRELIVAMVGADAVDRPGGLPDGLTEEYGIRLGMLKRAGVTMPGLGPLMMVQLLRDHNVSRASDPDATVEVSNWQNVEPGTIIMCEGRRGRFKNVEANGQLLVQLDGYRGMHEVSAVSVTLAKPKIDSVADEELEEEPLSAAQEQVLDAERESWKEGEEQSDMDLVWLTWNSVPAGTRIVYTNASGDRKTGKFVDFSKDNKVVLEIRGGKSIHVDPDQAEAPEKYSDKVAT